MNLIHKLFHKCKFSFQEKLINKNVHGTVWLETCKCGKKRNVYFDSKGECFSIVEVGVITEPIKR